MKEECPVYSLWETRRKTARHRQSNPWMELMRQEKEMLGIVGYWKQVPARDIGKPLPAD